jgi:ABC-type antimicrobial peptide transport system permease subunit
VLAYGVSRRRREFAVRIALGAGWRDVVRLVVHDAAVMGLAGVGIGAFAALTFTIILSPTLYQVHHADVLALIAAEAVLLTVAFAACLGPMRQAASTSPMEIMRAT